MHHIEKRLSGFGLQVDPSNKKQAMFPQGATVLPNPNGTAPGFEVFWQNCRLLVLPGPPGECLPILDRKLNEKPELNKPSRYSWLLLGVIEADIARAIDKISNQYGASVELSYLWRYPYVEVGVTLFDKSAVSCLSEIDNYLAPYLASKNGLTALSMADTLDSVAINDALLGI